MTGIMEDTTLIELFKISPAILALLVVIILQHKQLTKKDEQIKSMFELTDEDHKRQAKLMTLLEILVNRGES